MYARNGLAAIPHYRAMQSRRRGVGAVTSCGTSPCTWTDYLWSSADCGAYQACVAQLNSQLSAAPSTLDAQVAALPVGNQSISDIIAAGYDTSFSPTPAAASPGALGPASNYLLWGGLAALAIVFLGRR